MKKILLALSSISFLMRAEDDMESMAEKMSDTISDMSSRVDDVMSSLSYKMKIMMYWYSMSFVHKMILVGLGVLLMFWILCKLMHHRKGSCSCGCGKGGCGCHSK